MRVLEKEERHDVMEDEEGSAGDAASSSSSCLCDYKVITASKNNMAGKERACAS